MLDGEIRIDKTNKEIERYDTAISVINEGVELAGLSFDIDDIDVLQHEINNDLEPLCLKKEIIIEELSALRKDKAHISSRLKIAKGYYSEVNEDYEYAQSLSNEIECPTCGASYNNSVVEKFTLYQDADQLLSLIKRFDKEFSEIVDLIAEKNLELNNLSHELEKLNNKYSSKIVDDIEPGTALSLLASKFSSNRIGNNRKQKVDVIDKVLRKNKELKAERLANVKLKRKQVKDRFQLRFGDFLFKLKSFGVDSSSVPSILSYNKVPNSGGAAESIRAMLSYYISVYNIVDEFSEEVLAPLVIDTPNQHEQANNHYDNIVDFLMTELPKDSQLFLCSMDDVKLDPLKGIGNVIYLEDERSLLKKDIYELVSAFIALKIDL
ncbi:hypothetical protein F8A90_09725 [Cobetia sp. cqz5-12]|uniref:hypothetical protein n=1 Tax=Cobetia sp. cqz5-12 TaxID=2609415 RepID=UPI001908F7CF|nr:hypothetical protein [Cobetia sp. cqz5-12]QQK64372.1 hypothetical protein F8A90_09725 [Cobetia sp. cqz5-12]